MRLMLAIFWFFLCAFVSTKGYAEEKNSQVKAFRAPVIEAYSKTSFGLYKGDTVQLRVDVVGQDLTFRWMRAGRIFCETDTCRLDTSDWGYGVHKISFVVFNSFGSLFLTYHITLLRPKPGYKPSDLEAPLVFETKEVEKVKFQDFVTMSLGGKGYSYHGKKVQVIGHEERVLEWDETLRSQLGGFLRFGQKKVEAHVLFDGGVVHLATSSPKRRVIFLTRGSIRSRQLNDEMPQCTILVGDGSSQSGSRIGSESWLQIDGDNKGDFAVIRQEVEDEGAKSAQINGDVEKSQSLESEGPESLSQSRAVSIQVYRGQVRVFIQRGAFGQGDAYVIPSGFEIEISKPKGASRKGSNEFSIEIYPNRIRKLHRILRDTSSEYVFGAENDEKSDGWMLVPRISRPDSLKLALKTAKNFNDKGEFFKALEILSPFWRSDSDDLELRQSATEAYARLGWYNEAQKVLEEGPNLKEKIAGKTLLYLGVLELLESRSKKSFQTLSLAKDKLDDRASLQTDPLQNGTLDYYLGVAAYRAQEYHEAENHLRKVTENTAVPEYIRDEASGLLQESSIKKDFDLKLGLGLINDSNVMRLNSDELVTFKEGAFQKSASWGLVSAVDAALWGYRDIGGDFGALFQLRRVDYSEKSLKQLAPLDQEFGVTSSLRLGIDEITKKSWFEVGLSVLFGMRYVGDERALDSLKSSLHFGSPKLLNTYLDIVPKLTLDPIPLRDDLFDPDLEEISGPDDRSRKNNVFSLGIEPYKKPDIVLGLKLSRDSAVFRSEGNKNQNYQDLKTEIYGDFKFARGLFSSFQLERTNRKFASFEPEKSHVISGIEGSLGIKDILSLNHRLRAGMQKRQSTIELFNYSRTLYEYMASLEF